MESAYEDVKLTGESDDSVVVEDELSYTGNDCHSVPSFLSQYAKRIRRLNLSYNMLTNIDEVANFEMLIELNLDNNLIDENTEFPSLPMLQTLTVTKNKIVDCKKFVDQMKQYRNLTYLSVLGNIACPNPLLGGSEEEYQTFRELVISELPQLKFLDFKPVTREERMNSAKAVDEGKEVYADETHSPVFDNSKPRWAGVGRVRYSYVGKKSEGNRFIRNNDL